MARVAITRRPLDVAALLREVADVRHGATVLFIGTVRDQNEGRSVEGIEYAAYEPMAVAELQRIAEECVSRFGSDAIVVEHRLGRLALGESSVAIVVAHPRRAAAFDASRWLLEELKRRVPIWKREEYADGTRDWVDPTRIAVGVPA